MIVFQRDRLVFGLLGDVHVHVDAVELGAGSGCVCDWCRTPLLAADGARGRPRHFVHAWPKSCHNDGERALAVAAATILGAERKIHVPDFRDGIRSGVNALGGLRPVESVAVRPIMPGAWPELRLTIYGQLVRLVIRPRLREPNVTVQPLYTETMPGILITINPGRAGSITAEDLGETLLKPSSDGSRLTFLKRWVKPEPKLLVYPATETSAKFVG